MYIPQCNVCALEETPWQVESLSLFLAAHFETQLGLGRTKLTSPSAYDAIMKNKQQRGRGESMMLSSPPERIESFKRSQLDRP